MFTPASPVDRDDNDMSACCSAYGNVAGAHFDEKIAKRDLASYRKKGPGPTARLLRDLLVGTGAVGGVVLDVGSGVGGLSFELLDRGAERVIAVDASPAYLAAAAQEATRRDRLGVVEFMHGDFVEFEPLLTEALRHAEHAFAYSYPRDKWYVHSAIDVENAVRWLKSNPFRAFVHPVDRMTQTIERAGFHLAGHRQTWQWCADVWVR